MTALSGLLTIRDLRDDSVVATTPLVIQFSYSSEVSAPGQGSLTLTFGDSAASAILDAASSPSIGAGRLPYLLDWSLDGGSTPDFSMLVMDPQDGLVVSQTGNSLWEGYMVRGVDRVTFHNVRFADAVFGAAGTILPRSFGTVPLEFGAGIRLRYAKGILRTTPGLPTWAGRHRLAYTPYVDDHIADVLVNSDDYAVMLPDALNTLLAQVTGVMQAGDTAAIGSRGYWVEDSGARTIRIGHVGTTVKGHFLQAATPGDHTQAQILEHGQPLSRTARLSTIVSLYKPVGGTSDHGLGTGTKIDSVAVINTDRGRSSIEWDTNLCVFAANGTGEDGVYYWAHDGLAYLIGQSLPGACSLAYFERTHTLYVASSSGVYTRNAADLTSTPWTRLGGLSAQVARIVVALWQAGGSGCNIVAEVKGAGSGGDGLYIYPGLDSHGGDYGYAGWSVLSQSVASAWNYTYPGDTLLTADPNDPATVLCLFSATDTALSAPLTSRFLTPNTSTITAMFTIPTGPDPTVQPGGCCVLTAMGALGMYLLDLRGTWTDLNADGSLVDSAGNAPTVHSVVAYNDVIVYEGVPQFVALIACTDAGPYVSPYLTGSGWRAMGIQSGVADVTFYAIAVGTPQTIVNRVVNRLYGATNQGLYVSHSSGAYWDNETADLLSLGGYFSDLGASLGLGPHLANDITSIGTIPPGGSVNTSGRNVHGAGSGPYMLPDDLVWVRVLDERNKWVYGLAHALSAHPYGATRFGEIQEITTDAQTDAKTASGRLGVVAVRSMTVWSTPQLLLDIESSFADTDSFLRSLRAQDLVDVTYDTAPTWGITLAATPMYVLKHQIGKAQGDIHASTVTTLGMRLRMTDITADEIAHGIQYALSRQQRYGR